jgi:hypothetical protein
VRLRPALAAAAVVLALVAGAVVWIASRTYGVEASSDGRVVVVHGLPFDVAGIDLSSQWQETSISAEAVRASDPGALSAGAQGQGEAVEEAAGLVWRFGLPQTPVVRLPPRDTAPERAPAPATPEQTPG